MCLVCVAIVPYSVRVLHVLGPSPSVCLNQYFDQETNRPVLPPARLLAFEPQLPDAALVTATWRDASTLVVTFESLGPLPPTPSGNASAGNDTMTICSPLGPYNLSGTEVCICCVCLCCHDSYCTYERCVRVRVPPASNAR